jgi:hypothetical protein
MRNISSKVVEKIKTTHFVFNNFFSRKWHFLCGNVEKFVEQDRPEKATWLMRIACWIPKATHSLTHKLIICNTNFFSTATIVAQIHLIVTFIVQCLSYYKYPD